MTLRLVPGQNAPLGQGVLRFVVAGDAAPSELDVSALVLAEDLAAASSDDFVFYNQPDAAGVHLRHDGVHIDLGDLPARARSVLCAFSIDTATVPGGRSVVASLVDEHGAAVVDFAFGWDGTDRAVICFELYRRAGAWKVRAVGQGYAGGLAQLLGAHGVEVDDQDAPADTPPTQDGAAGFLEPLNQEYPFERIQMIFEDAARSTAALLSARDYAAHRLDEEMSAAVADPATRTGPAADAARAVAQRRHDDLVAEALTRYDADASQLNGEVVAIDGQLPRALASWQSSSWAAPPKALHGDGIRVGEVTAVGVDRLTVPFCLPMPLRRPLWVDTPSTVAAAPFVSALVLRLLATTPVPPPILEVVDLTGALEELTGPLGRLMDGGVVRSHHDVSGKLAALVEAVDLAVLGRQSGLSDADLPARVVVLSDFGHGLQTDDLAQVAVMAAHGASAKLSLVIVGGDESESSDPLMREIAQFCEHLPVDGDARMRDPWAGNEWCFTPDSMPTDGVPMAQFLSSLAAP